jgi:cytidylate kinase
LRVVAFIGPSGTGKSHRAAWIAREKDIDFIIDDGLLIRGANIVAGTSAKKEKTKVSSIRRALFTKEQHVRDVTKALAYYVPEAILIIGTSDQMVEHIVKRLKLPPISEKVYIEDVATDLK